MLQALLVILEQGAAALVVVCKPHCPSLDFIKPWISLPGFLLKTPLPGFGYL